MYNKVIHSLIKDESHILNEWILHNTINIGFDHIYIYDDQSEISIKETISSLPSKILSKVTIFTLEKNINFYDVNEFQNSIFYDKNIYSKFNGNKQFYFLNHFLENYRNISEWCLFCDADEFIYLKDKNLDEILNEHNQHDIIYIPWLIYGSSFHIDQPEGLVIDNFRYHENKYHELGKSICRLSSLIIIDHAHYISMYQPRYSFDHNQIVYSSEIHINHYQINSIKLYIKRKLRNEIGNTNGTLRAPNDIFLFMLAYNSVYNNSMEKYIKNINNILKLPLTSIVNNLNYIYSINCLNIDNRLYFKISSYEELNKILISNNIKFLKFDEKIPEDFNLINYKKLNKDLSNMNDIDLLNHYILFGSREKRKYIKKVSSTISEDSDDLSCSEDESSISIDDIEEDEDSDDDNKSKNSSDSKSSESCFDNENGDSLLPYDFDVLVYKKLNDDLKNLSNINAIYHYLNNGIIEKRKYKINTLPDDFDPVIYKKINKDLNHLSNKEAEEHYVSNGIDEKRKYKKNNIEKDKNDLPPDDFDPEIYKKLNIDLRNMSNEEATNHYLMNGINEKRLYKKEDIINNIPEDFDPVIYKKLNKDLKNMSNEEATEHYLNNGIMEKRIYTKDSNKKKSVVNKEEEDAKVYKSIIPEDFSVELYKSLNLDLQNLSNSDAVAHYINFGIKERRKYKIDVFLPDDFDPVVYKKLNKDLQHMTDQESINHYLINGIDEKRKYIKLKSN